MKILDHLASALGRRDEQPNKELAQSIAANNDTSAVKELVEHLSSKKKDIRHDCIKILDEIGIRKPALVMDYFNDFVSLLHHKDNRMQWGAMCTIDAITKANHKAVYKALPAIMSAAEKGSVITKDHCVSILVKLGALKQYSNDVFPLLLEMVQASPVNQFPTYAEKALTIVTDTYKQDLLKIVNQRMDEANTAAKRKRLEKVIKKLQVKS